MGIAGASREGCTTMQQIWQAFGLQRHRAETTVHRWHLDVHLIMDTYGTQRTPRIRSWFAKRPRFYLTPTSGSWLKVVALWFGDLTNEQLRGDVPRSVAQLLKAAIREFNAAHHAKATSLVQSQSADTIVASIDRIARRILDCQAGPPIAPTTRSRR